MRGNLTPNTPSSILTATLNFWSNKVVFSLDITLYTICYHKMFISISIFILRKSNWACCQCVSESCGNISFIISFSIWMPRTCRYIWKVMMNFTRCCTIGCKIICMVWTRLSGVYTAGGYWAGKNYCRYSISRLWRTTGVKKSIEVAPKEVPPTWSNI